MRNFGVTDYENVSGIDDIGMSRLAQRYAQAVTQRKAADLRREQEVELTPYLPQLEAARRKLARALEAESENIGGHLPVSSVYDALQVVRAQRTANIGIRALTSHLETLWKANRQASLSANSFTTLREHYTRNYPRAGMSEVFDAIAKTGYLALPMSDLVKMASEIRTQQDFELAMMKHGLDGRQPHQVKARKFVLAVLNGEAQEDASFERQGSRAFDRDEEAYLYRMAWLQDNRGNYIPWNREEYSELEDGVILKGYTLGYIRNDSFGAGEEMVEDPKVGDLPKLEDVWPDWEQDEEDRQEEEDNGMFGVGA